jgi:F-type H+-transporting ATPase subunit b
LVVAIIFSLNHNKKEMEKLISEFSVGLFFWQTLLFLTLLFLLRKYAWKPTLDAVNERERSIEEALEQAEQARNELKNLKESNNALLNEAREERDVLMKEARTMKNEIINEAKNKAKEDAEKIITSAREEIKNEKNKAIEELKNQVADFSFEIAEKVIAQKLNDADKQNEMVTSALNEINFN